MFFPRTALRLKPKPSRSGKEAESVAAQEMAPADLETSVEPLAIYKDFFHEKR